MTGFRSNNGEIQMSKKRLLLAIVIASLATPAIARDDDATVACLVGRAAVSLHEQMHKTKDARTAANIAMRSADVRCKGRLSEGASDYVYHSINGMAKAWFDDREDK
jgi:hypothetical protein